MNDLQRQGARMAKYRPDITIFLMWVGGGRKETVMWHLARGFSDAGYKVDVVLGNAASDYRYKIPDCARIVDLKTHGYTRSTLKLLFYLVRHRPKVLVSTLPFSAIPATLARVLSMTRCHLFVRICNNMARRIEHERRAFPWYVLFFLKHLPRLATGVIACSKGTAGEISRITGIPLNRIHVLYNPAIPDEMTRIAMEPVDHEWLVSRNNRVILGVGRLAPQKNFAMLIRAFAKVRQKIDARLLILGEGPERARLERLVRDLGLENDVSLPGYVENPCAYMARARVFVLSSSWEGFGNVVAEAMAVGTRVVSTDCPSGPSEILDGGRHGILVPVDDVRAMASAILRVLEEGPEDVAAIGDGWLHRFTVRHNVDKFLDLFGLTGSPEAPPPPGNPDG